MACYNILIGLITASFLFSSCCSQRWQGILPNVAKKSFDVIGKDNQFEDGIDIDSTEESAFIVDLDTFPSEFGSGGEFSGDDEFGSGSGTDEEATTASAVIETKDPCDEITCQNEGVCLRESQNFRCRCPLGTFGDLCEEFIDISYPQFYGHSYMYFEKPVSINMYDAFEMTIKFKTMDRDGILVFGSQMESPRGDFFSLELRDGMIEFRFSLGLPEVKITSKSEIDLMDWHTITIKRDNNIANMVIDGGERLTIVAEDTYRKMSLNQKIYIGGHTVDAYHKNEGKGLTGCIEELKINDYIFDMRQTPLGDAINGIDVGECSSGLCMADACVNGGSCVVTSTMNYQCLCQLGFGGVSCELELDLIVPSFGGYSYLAFEGLNKKHLTFFELSMIVKPHKPNGVLAYCAQSSDGNGDFVSLNLVNGYVEFRFDCGSGPAIVRSSEKLDLNKWNSVAISRTGRDAVLMVNDVGEVKGMSPGGFSQTTFKTDLFIGGVPNYDNVASKAELSVGMVGDIQRLKIDGFPVDLVNDALYGIGIVNANHHCTNQPCQNDAVCQADYDQHKCHCHLSYYGENCENEHDIKIEVPMFSGMSYLKFTDTNILKRLTGLTTDIRVDFKTVSNEGLMLWTGQDAMTSSSDFMSLGLQNGILRLSYNLGSGETSVTANTSINDGEWHTVSISRIGREAKMTVDKKEIVSAVTKGSLSYLNTNNGMFIGGMNDIEALTLNRYYAGFQGCIRNVELASKVGTVVVELVGGAQEGRNIHHCT
ncbi:pikachurin-like [Antedon mediterranea]|uniref:pikachurin-like n=1 Tax=Antedon mediterranea TaxID=105859 RepID=UPI003AF53E4F